MSLRDSLLVALLALAPTACAGDAPGVTSDGAAPDEAVAPWDSGAPVDLAAEDLREPPVSFGETRSLADPPPALSGGTLLVSRDGTLALAADPDRDRVLLVDLGGPAPPSLRQAIALPHGSDPGRIVEDAAGDFHVVLRAASAIADLGRDGGLRGLRAVCPAPRGLALRPRQRDLLVACATGELNTLPAAAGAAVALARIDRDRRDLRDLVVDESTGGMIATTLRTAELLSIDDRGAVTARWRPGSGGGVPSVAFRASAIPGGGVALVHGLGNAGQISTQEAGYGDGSLCLGARRAPIVTAAVTRFVGAQAALGGVTTLHPGVVLPVDVALARSGTMALISAGSARRTGLPQVVVLDAGAAPPACASKPDPRPIQGRAVALAFDSSENLYVQTREPSSLVLYRGPRLAGAQPLVVPLGGAPRTDTGWEIFHSDPGGGIACASCHPEGGDDARTWEFDFGPRRTQWLRGGITRRPPYHWNGDVTDLGELVQNVFSQRMFGPRLDAGQQGALAAWLDTLPALPSPPLDSAAVTRGRTLFLDPAIGCGDCHSGPQLTDGKVHDVGREMPFKTPSLVDLADHPPYLHDGCAPSLPERFVPACGGPMHGKADPLQPAQLADLITFLESL